MHVCLAFHQPKPEHLDDLLDGMARLRDAGADLDGCVHLGGWVDDATGRVFAVSVWRDQDAALAGMGQLAPVIADAPFDEWEVAPPEALFTLRDGLAGRGVTA